MQRTKFKEKKQDAPLALDIEFCQDNGDVIIKIPRETLIKAKSRTNVEKHILNTINRLQYKNQGDSTKVAVSEDLFLYLLLGIYLCRTFYSVKGPYSKKGKTSVKPLPKEMPDTDESSKKSGIFVADKRKPKSFGFGFLEAPPKPNEAGIDLRTDYYMPIAKRLSNIIHTKKKITHTKNMIRQWSHQLRILTEKQGVSIDRIKAAVDWYEENIGGEYVPVIESGFSFRSKFQRIEAAMTKEREPTKSKKRYIEYDGIRYVLGTDGEYRDASGNIYIE